MDGALYSFHGNANPDQISDNPKNPNAKFILKGKARFLEWEQGGQGPVEWGHDKCPATTALKSSNKKDMAREQEIERLI